MYGINVGLEIGKRALLAQQYSLNVTGLNISIVNTPGFTRQQALLQATIMIIFEHAYEAAARVIDSMDEALDLIINRMGLVGR